jgi:hypothetical protein
MRQASLRPAFVKYVPDPVDEGVLYVSLENRTAVHKCCCGCGSEVVTPLDPTQWSFIYDGRASLHPSVGSWNLKCRSHYWIQQNTIKWAEPWTDAHIAAARQAQQKLTTNYYSPRSAAPPTVLPETESATTKTLFERLWNWLSRL